MAPDMMTALYDAVAQDPDLQRRFLAAGNIDEIRTAVTAAGFDPDAPEIATALGLDGMLDEADLETTTAGVGNATGSWVAGLTDFFGQHGDPRPVRGGWGPGTSGGGPADAWA